MGLATTPASSPRDWPRPGRVITAAAAIMLVVFAAIVPSDQVFIKVFGVGMVAAILVDSTIIRALPEIQVSHR